MQPLAIAHYSRVSKIAAFSSWSPFASFKFLDSGQGFVGLRRGFATQTGMLLGCSGLRGWRMNPSLGCGFQTRLLQAGGCALDIQSREGAAAVGESSAPASAQSAGQEEGAAVESRAAVMRRLLASPGIQRGPACHNALSAKLCEKMNFGYVFMNGFGVAASRLALPDTGLISYGEMADQGRQLTGAVSIPVIADGETGYGTLLNVKRTVRGYIHTGFAGIVLEDQDIPRACGHTPGRKVVSRENAVARIKAAVDAREESFKDIVIVGRTDARQAVSLDEALWRVQAFADAGADVLFIDALASRDEMHTFMKVAPGVPKMLNMLEGGGRTPLSSSAILEEIGFKLVCYPLSLIGVSIRAMRAALHALKSGRIPPPSDLATYEDLKNVLGFNEYFKEEQRYITPPSTGTSSPDSKVTSTASVKS